MQKVSNKTAVEALAPSEPDHRSRLLDAIAEAVTEKGYAQVTIADIVRHARVSKRTFYECFPDKEACFLAAYTRISEQMLARIASAAMAHVDLEQRLDAATQAYVAMLEERPVITRTFLLEIQAAGEKAVQVRRAIQERFVDLLCVLVEAARKERPEIASLPRPLATAIAGGINELLIDMVEARPGARGRGAEKHKVGDLSEVGRTANVLLRAVLLRDALGQEPPWKKGAPRRQLRDSSRR